jgi:cytochrome P450
VERGECEFVSDFSKRMPTSIIMSLLGLPTEDLPFLLEFAEDAVRSGGDPTKQADAFVRVATYVAQKVIPQRRAAPGDDIISAIVKAQVDGGRPMTDDELVGLSTVLIGGGLDTVASMLGFITLFLATHPAHCQQLVQDPALINDALEELMRRHHITTIGRVVIKDMDFKGVQLKAGDFILTPTAAAGVDPRRYPDPYTVNFRREDKKHLVFGKGPHQCIGSLLARTELRVFLQEWLKRIPQFAIKAGEQPIAKPGKANGVHYLPLTWNPA